jgi:diacylglycerol kinase (ATP)
MKHNHQLVDALAAALVARGLAPQVVWDREQRQTLLADPQLASRFQCIVAAGGDGSLGDVINELHHTPAVPLAVLPMGNENLFARQLGFTPNPDTLANAIAQAKTLTIDLGCANNRLFSLIVGI